MLSIGDMRRVNQPLNILDLIEKEIGPKEIGLGLRQLYKHLHFPLAYITGFIIFILLYVLHEIVWGRPSRLKHSLLPFIAILVFPTTLNISMADIMTGHR